MIHTVRIRGFKRFGEVGFHLPGHVVLAGPNNTGKTTVLQAIASWDLALRRWRGLNDFNPRQGYTWAPVARQDFVAVPLRSFDLLWTDRQYRGQIEIELRHSAGWAVAMELSADSTEQIYVRPKSGTPPEDLKKLDLQTVLIPPMTGIGIEEPLYRYRRLTNSSASEGRAKCCATCWQKQMATMLLGAHSRLLSTGSSGISYCPQIRVARISGQNTK